MRGGTYYALLIYLKLFYTNSSSTSSDEDGINFIVPCNSSACLKSSVQSAIPGFMAGLPQYQIKSLDPFVIDFLEIVLPGDLSVIFSKGVTLGFGACLVDYANLQEKNFEVSVHCNLSIAGKYKTKGQLLIFPINGEGDSLIKCRNINFVFSFQMGSNLGPDGKKYATILSFKSQHRYDGRVSYYMTNLFEGNPEISEAVVKFMNENWKLIAEEFGTPIVNFGVGSILRNVKQFLKIVSIEKMTTSLN